MNIFNTVRTWFAKAVVKATGGNLTLIPRWLRYAPFFPSWPNLVREAYKGNATVFACMWLLQRTFVSPELWAWKQNAEGEYDPIPEHVFRKLIQKPNPDMGEREFKQFVITYAPLGGSVFIWMQRGQGGGVIALWPFHRGQVTPIPGRNTEEGLVHYYVLDVGNGEYANPWGLDRHDNLMGVAIPKTEMLQWKWAIDPEYPWEGMGALIASASDVDLRNELRRFIFSLLKNDASPRVVVTMAEGEQLDEDVVMRLRAQWKQAHGGENRGTPGFLEAGMKIERLGFNMQEMQIESLADGPDVAICSGFGIQPAVVGTLVGLKNSGVQANFEEANRMYHEMTLVPLWESFSSEMQQGLSDKPQYIGIRIAFNLKAVRALQENLNETEKRLVSGWNAGALTRAQYLRGLGYEASPTDEVLKVTLTTSFVPVGQMVALPVSTQGVPPSADSAPENLESVQGLNGAQINAALDIMARLAADQISQAAAVELMVAMGLEREMAEKIVNSVEANPNALEELKRKTKGRGDAPGYGPGRFGFECATCAFFTPTYCKRYQFAAQPEDGCQAWQKYEWASTQVDLPVELHPLFFQLTGAIAEEDLIQDGREMEPHITVKYGLLPDTLAAVVQVADKAEPFALAFGEVAYFSNDEFDVVFVEVFSQELIALHEAIQKAAPHVTTHPVYQPHLTLAYLKPGLGPKYAGEELADMIRPGWNEPFLLSTRVRVAQISFSQVDGTKVILPLRGRKGEPEPEHKGDNWLHATKKRLQPLIDGQRKLRTRLQGRMEADVQAYFDGLAKRVVGRARASEKADQPPLPGFADLFEGEEPEHLARLMERYALEIAMASWEYLNVALDETIDLDLTNPAITKLLEKAAKQVRGIDQETRQAVIDLLKTANDNGWSIYDLVRGKDGHTGLEDLVAQTYRGRAEAIARTELGHAQNGASFERYKAGGVKHVMVFDNGFANSHPFCTEIDGKVVSLEWMERNPLQHPRCLVPGTQVLAPNLRTAYRRKFEGKVVTLRTASNHELTVTLNHPILTDRGWVAAGKLRPGDHVVHSLDGEGIKRLFDPYDNQMETPIENLFDASLETLGVSSVIMPGAPEQFHGDGFDGEVHIVFADGFLRGYAERFSADLMKHLEKRPLKLGMDYASLFHAEGAPFEKLKALFASTDRLVSRFGALQASFGRKLSHFQGAGFRERTDVKATPLEGFSQSASVHPDFIREHLTTRPTLIAGVQGVEIETVKEIGVDGQTSLPKAAVDDLLRNVEFIGESLDRFTSHMALVEIVEVRESDFSGHVYNLETTQGWYLANGIITHNCVRAFGPVFDYDGEVEQREVPFGGQFDG